jgi:hypothetical protein
MNTKLRTFKVLVFVSIFLSSMFAGIMLLPQQERSASAKLIEFHSYLDFDFNADPLNEPLAIDVSVTVPVEIKYSTDIPDFFSKIPFPFNFLLLYGQSIGPMQQINLEIVDPPDWANIYLSSPDIYLDIPFKADGERTKTTNLVLSPRVESPAESYTIKIRATCGDIGKLKGVTYQESLSFTPSFIPTIGINTEDPVRTVGPHESVNFKITIANRGNKITRVTPQLINSSNTWTPTINPTQYEIPPSSEATFTFSVVSPFEFGWHNDYEKFQIDFKAEVYPYRSAAATSTRSVYLVINNYGFSTPGFELVFVAFAVIFVGFIIKKKNNR